MSLLPARIPKGKFARLSMTDFKGVQLVGPEPTASMVASVRTMGVFDPIIVFKPEEGRLKVGAGVRRIKASFITEKKDIPAMIYTDDENFRNAVTLAENNHRSPNPLAEVRSIMRFQKKRFSVSQIAEQLNLPRVRVEERLRLSNVIKPLYDAMFKGQIAVSIGAAASRLPVPFQKQLASKLKRDGKLTQKDVTEVKSVRRDAAVAALPKAIFADPPKPAALNGDERELLTLLIESWVGPKKVDPKRAERIDTLLTARKVNAEAAHAKA